MLARLGRSCFRHRRLVLLAWLVAFVGGITAGVQVFPRLDTDYSGSSIESFAGYDHLELSAEFGSRISALVDRPTDADGQQALSAALADLRITEGVARAVDPLTARAEAGLVSPDGTKALVVVDLTRGLEGAPLDEAVDATTNRLRQLGDDLPGEVLLGGNELLQRESAEQSQRDTERGELVALPITLAVMVLLFGGFVAAGVPLLGALCSIAGGLAALLGVSYLMDLDPSVPSVTTVMGLGLSIDYALLIVQRYREERGLGRGPEDAVAVALSTAGRTISFSALTVATALTGLFVFELSIFRALGAAGVTVVVVALLVGLTLVPALIGAFHRRIRVPTTRVSDDGFFSRMARRTQRHALLVTLLLSGLLLALGTPFLRVEFQNGGADLLPEDFEARRYVEAVAAAFPTEATDPVLVLARVPAAELQTWADTVADLPEVARVAPAEDRQQGWSMVEITPQGETQGHQAQDLVDELRTDRPDFETWVTGPAAILVDFKALVLEGLPWALTILVVGTFVLLFLMTGSVLVPVKALVMNTLSLGATFGVLVWVFQDGHLSGVLDFTPTGALETWVPVVVFAFAFGLSMDYEVFLLSRVKELYDSGLSNDDAVAVGLQRSGRIITSAALLVLIVFLGFTSGKLLGIKQMGLALATAVAVDATLVRCLLVPATMTLLGDKNWWAPPWLRRVHDRIGLREHVEPPPVRQPATDPVEVTR
ncbi:MAG TPA: MMPL family transporter [Actinomycetes bacterium]|nr:MMPL family transporter [Actinomycetes bacterium]